MKSNHSFKLRALYPATGERIPYQPISYSEVYFREPETFADQTRLNGIVNVGDSAGYYIDIFRSRKVEGGDKMHDYFYHNLGQQMTLTAADGSELELQPTQELAFAGAHLYAYSYIYNKKRAVTSKDVKAGFTIQMPDKDDITMNLWMKGEEGREIFSALSPMTEGLSRIKNMPYSIKDQPTLTFVARQKGEAWNRPFVAVYEPSTLKEPSCIASVDYPQVKSEQQGSHVGIRVALTNGNVDWILSSDENAHHCKLEKLQARAGYALCRQSEKGETLQAFLGNGTQLEADGVSIRTDAPADVLLLKQDGKWMYTATAPCRVVVGKKKYTLQFQKSYVFLK